MTTSATDAPGATPPDPAPPPPGRPLGLLPPLAFVALGLTLMALRVFDGPAARWLARYAAFEGLPEKTLLRVDDLLLVPAASVLVVFCRVTLGLRMLGPFRPILIALAFYNTGVAAGTVFIAVVMTIVVLVRPRLESGLLPYFGRLTVLLSIVVLVELLVLMVGTAVESEKLVRVAIFPIIVLCLSADGFARVLSSDGLGPATWRGTVTVAIAAAISTIGSIPAVADFLFRFPELVLVEIGLILFISTRMKWGLLADRQPVDGKAP